MRIGNTGSSNVDLNTQETRTQQPAAQVQTQTHTDNYAPSTGRNASASMRQAENSINASMVASSLRNAGSSSLGDIVGNVSKNMKSTGVDKAATDTVSKTATPNAAIKDLQTTTSTIHFDDDGTVDTLKLDLNIAHTYPGDLVVKLTSPSGKEFTVSNRAGGRGTGIQLSGKDLSAAFPGESIKGDWKLSVSDQAKVDTGTLKSWSLSVGKKGNPGGGGTTGTTTLQVSGDAAFKSKVARDLDKFAPGTTVDANGYVHAATTQQAGHATGYQLINNLLNGGKLVTIGFTSQNAFTSSGTGAQGSPSKPSAGSTAQVSYDPDWSSTIALPTRQNDGTIKDQTVDSAVVLAHELIHATHAQRGTIDRSLVDHFFSEGGTNYKENWRFEELRTTGFEGFRQGTEPSENSIRAELGFNARASYLFRDSWQVVGGIAPKTLPNTNPNSGIAGGWNPKNDID